MNDHAELLKDARELAKKIGSGEYDRIYWVTDSEMLRTLADIVEQQDKPPDINAELLAACRTCDANNRPKVDAFDELVVACRVCDETIEAFAGILHEGIYPNKPMSSEWINVRTAGYLAKQAVENADKANLVKDARRQLDTIDEEDWIDLDEFKAEGGA